MTSGTAITSSGAGIGPSEPVRLVTQLPDSVTGCGAIAMSTPSMTKYVDSVATTGVTRSSTMISPFATPMAVVISSTSGIAASGPPRPAGTSHTISAALANVITGEIVRSKPPPPEMIAGVLAIAAIASGAKFASCSVMPNLLTANGSLRITEDRAV